MVSNRTLNDLLDRIGSVETREEKVLILRRGIDRLLRARDAQRVADRLERLGKLGGG